MQGKEEIVSEEIVSEKSTTNNKDNGIVQEESEDVDAGIISDEGSLMTVDEQMIGTKHIHSLHYSDMDTNGDGVIEGSEEAKCITAEAKQPTMADNASSIEKRLAALASDTCSSSLTNA